MTKRDTHLPADSATAAGGGTTRRRFLVGAGVASVGGALSGALGGAFLRGHR